MTADPTIQDVDREIAEPVAWLIEETWSGHVYYIHRDFNYSAWIAENDRDDLRRANGILPPARPIVTKDIDQAMRFPTKVAADAWMGAQPHWLSKGGQYQVREHMWPAPASPPPSARVEGLDLDALEKVAQRANNGEWRTDYRFGEKVVVKGAQRFPICDTGTAPHGEANVRRQEANAAHIATFDPPTVLSLISAARTAQGVEPK